MKQILQNFKTGELKLEDVPKPIVKKEGVLVKTYYSVISAGTEKMMIDLAKKGYLGKAKERPDLVKQVLNKTKNEGLINTYKAVMNKIDYPVPLGYSCAGKIIAVGEEVDEFKVGDYVACAGAGYANHAEYNYVPKNLVVKINKTEKIKECSFATLGSIAMQGVRQADVKLGENVVIIGLGLLGQIAAQILKAAGCKVIGIDYDESKLELAKQNGIQQSILLPIESPVEKIMNFTNGYGADKILITAATKENEPVEMAAKIARDRATIVMVGVTGINIPRKLYYEKELQFKLSRSYGPGRYDYNYEEKSNDYPIGYVRWTENRNMQEVIRLIEEGLISINSLITHEFKIQDAQEAYNFVLNNPNNEKYIGVLLEYDKEEIEKSNKVYISNKSEKVRRINFGLIGAGNFTKSVFLPNLNKLDEVNFVGVASAGGINAKLVAEKYKFSYATSNYNELLDDKDINLIGITSTHNLHAEMIIQAFKNGKNVYVEKPLCIYEEELKDIYKTYKESNKELMVGFNRRFSPHIEKIKGFLGNKTSELILNYRINAGNISKNNWINDPDIGGGRIIGEVCHFVDLIQYITKSKPVKVYAEKINGNNDEIINEDNILVTLTFQNGSIGNILYTSIGDKSYPKENLEIFGNEAVIKMKNFCLTEFYKNESKTKFKTIGQNKGFEEAYKAFIKGLILGSGSPIRAEDLFLNTLTTFRIKDALITGKAQDIVGDIVDYKSN